jgi:PAS domain S-box-containing protein
MSFVKTAERLFFSSQLFFAAFILIVIAALALGETAVLGDSYRQVVLAGTTGFCVALAFAALILELLARAADLEHHAKELTALARALRESEARFRGFALTSSDWFWETDEHHHFTYLSEGIRAFGHDPEACLGRSRMEFAADAESEAPKWQEHFAMLNRHQSFRDFVYTRKIDNQTEYTGSVSGDPFFDPSGRFLGYRGTARDVTEQVRAERRLREAKEAAEAANRTKSQFLANMSHELRTPLNAIIGFADLLKRGVAGPVQPRQEEYAGLIQQSGEQLHKVINDILDFAKVDAGKFELHEETGVEPCQIINACVCPMIERAKAGAVHLSTEIEDGLPSVAADPTRLKQILLNLMSNAIKFTEPGGSVVVAVRHHRDGGLVLEVRDTGVGMTPEEIVTALEPFEQVDAGHTRQHEGAGLGLPLARQLAELHGWVLHLSSKKGVGTIATLTLPASGNMVDMAMARGDAAASAA